MGDFQQIACKFAYFVFAQRCGQVCVHVDICVKKTMGGKDYVRK